MIPIHRHTVCLSKVRMKLGPFFLSVCSWLCVFFVSSKTTTDFSVVTVPMFAMRNSPGFLDCSPSNTELELGFDRYEIGYF